MSWERIIGKDGRPIHRFDCDTCDRNVALQEGMYGGSSDSCWTHLQRRGWRALNDAKHQCKFCVDNQCKFCG